MEITSVNNELVKETVKTGLPADKIVPGSTARVSIVPSAGEVNLVS